MSKKEDWFMWFIVAMAVAASAIGIAAVEIGADQQDIDRVINRPCIVCQELLVARANAKAADVDDRLHALERGMMQLNQAAERRSR